MHQVVAAAGPVDHAELVRNSEELFSLALNIHPSRPLCPVLVCFFDVLCQGHFRSGDGKRKEDWALQKAENVKRRLRDRMQEKPAFYGAELLYRSQEAGSLQCTCFLFKCVCGVKGIAS